MLPTINNLKRQEGHYIFKPSIFTSGLYFPVAFMRCEDKRIVSPSRLDCFQSGAGEQNPPAPRVPTASPRPPHEHYEAMQVRPAWQRGSELATVPPGLYSAW